jgi:FKBP-type peptidyl-prolyl cis-trans isomerase SlpA
MMTNPSRLDPSNVAPGAEREASVGIREGSHVTLHFRLALADGQIIFDTFSDHPATIQVGQGQIAPALERCLMALQEGDERSYSLEPDDGFGPRNPELIQRVSRSLLDQYSDGSEPIEPGDVVEFPTPDGLGGRVAGVFKGWEGDAALFDFNHPLAGQAMTFDVKIIGLL